VRVPGCARESTREMKRGYTKEGKCKYKEGGVEAKRVKRR
jgi:hypothetical protein